MISVIVPAHNAAPTVQRCLKSLRESTATQIEIIVVDDGSTDGTAGLCEALAGVVVPKLERIEQLETAGRALAAAGLPDLPVLAGLETALGVADARALAAHPEIDLTVFYCLGLEERRDPGFARSYTWDVPLLDGYRYVFLRNLSPRPSVSFSYPRMRTAASR